MITLNVVTIRVRYGAFWQSFHRVCGLSMDIHFPEFEIFTRKIDTAWTALQRQYASRITGAELDHLFACLVFGLTSRHTPNGSRLFISMSAVRWWR